MMYATSTDEPFPSDAVSMHVASTSVSKTSSASTTSEGHSPGGLFVVGQQYRIIVSFVVGIVLLSRRSGIFNVLTDILHDRRAR